MAVQMHIAFSSIVNGSAVFAGGPWFCAQGSIATAENSCMGTWVSPPDVPKLVSLTKSNADLQTLDPIANLADDRTYLFSATKDITVYPEVMKSLQTYYQSFLKIPNIITNFLTVGAHNMPTLDYGNACTLSVSPYLAKCGDGAGEALQTLYGADIRKGAAVTTNLKSFDQTPFIVGTNTSIGGTGFIYVPTRCALENVVCRLHVDFHGCLQTYENIKDVYAANAGYNPWAEANDIIVVYPYAKPSNSNPSNPNGCWDWWGYTDKNYANKNGVQMKFARRVIDAITGGSLTPTNPTTPTLQPAAAPGVPTIYPTQAVPTIGNPTMFPTQQAPTLFPTL